MAEETPDNGETGADAQPTPNDTPGEAVGAVDAMAEAALESANAAADALRTEVTGSSGDSTLDLPSFDGPEGVAVPSSLAMLNDVDLQVKVELGRTRMYLEDVLRLNENSVVELDKAAGDPVDIYVNDRPIARGEVLVLDDNFCVRISEILEPLNNED